MRWLSELSGLWGNYKQIDAVAAKLSPDKSTLHSLKRLNYVVYFVVLFHNDVKCTDTTVNSYILYINLLHVLYDPCVTN